MSCGLYPHLARCYRQLSKLRSRFLCDLGGRLLWAKRDGVVEDVANLLQAQGRQQVVQGDGNCDVGATGEVSADADRLAGC